MGFSSNAFAFAVLAACLHAVQAVRMSMANRGFLIVSSPTTGQIVYMVLQTPAADVPETSVLLDSKSGLVNPMGLAVDQQRRRLLVADPGQGALLSYELQVTGNTLSTGARTVLVNSTQIRWVAVNDVSDVVYSDEQSNSIMMITSSVRPGQNDSNASIPITLYGNITKVNSPGGVVTDSFFTYWVNKNLGTQVGSVIKGTSVPTTALSATPVSSLSANTDKSEGICLVQDSLLYTQPTSTIYGVKRSGSSVALITDNLKAPRGCVWDGAQTVYVADFAADAVYSFPSTDLSKVQVVKTIALPGPYGMAVLLQTSQASMRWSLVMTMAIVIGAWLRET